MLFKAFQGFLRDEEEKACTVTINRLTFFLPPQDHTRNTGEGDKLREPGVMPALPNPNSTAQELLQTDPRTSSHIPDSPVVLNDAPFVPSPATVHH